MADISHIGVLGAGTIGASWTALFLANGYSVSVYDPDPEAKEKVLAYIKSAAPALDQLGLTEEADWTAVEFFDTLAKASEGADFIQENVPERLQIKHATYREIEPVLAPHTIVSSSTSGLTLEDLQKGWEDPAKLILGHPFNPPHLIPLVELTANERTGAGLLDRTRDFYESIGKVTITIEKALPGHVANRLQAALWREAIYMAVEGVASVEDIDKAVWAGPGLRWAAMGPTSLFHLGAGDGGIRAYCEHFKDNFNGWWANLGDIQMDDAVIDKLVKGMEDQAKGRSVADLSAERDRLLLGIQTATKGKRA